MMSGGVFAGAKIAYQDDTSNPGTPDSASVGKSGRNAERFLPVVASAVTRFELMKGTVPGNAEIMTCTCPATTSVSPPGG